ncbi:hypothetical protein, partial [Nostoc sp.]|uniref:hypothetical protein n=1 Tax=Nostoc sp. TaxID=1180 RepID=UPI002FF4B1A4
TEGTSATHWLPRQLLQRREPPQRTGSHASCYNGGNLRNALAPTPVATMEGTSATHWLPYICLDFFTQSNRIAILHFEVRNVG